MFIFFSLKTLNNSTQLGLIKGKLGTTCKQEVEILKPEVVYPARQKLPKGLYIFIFIVKDLLKVMPYEYCTPSILS